MSDSKTNENQGSSAKAGLLAVKDTSAAKTDRPRNAGQRLLGEVLTARGLSLRAAAAVSGLPKTSLGEWLSGRVVPDDERRQAIHRAFAEVPPIAWDRVSTWKPPRPAPPGNSEVIREVVDRLRVAVADQSQPAVANLAALLCFLVEDSMRSVLADPALARDARAALEDALQCVVGERVRVRTERVVDRLRGALP